MELRGSEKSFMLLVVMVAVGFGRTLMSFSNASDNGAERTLTREAILSLRPAAPTLDLLTCLRIRSLGCAGCRRGCRGGKPKVKQTLSAIPVVLGRRFSLARPDSTASQRRQRVLRPVSVLKSEQCSENDSLL